MRDRFSALRANGSLDARRVVSAIDADVDTVKAKEAAKRLSYLIPKTQGKIQQAREHDGIGEVDHAWEPRDQQPLDELIRGDADRNEHKQPGERAACVEAFRACELQGSPAGDSGLEAYQFGEEPVLDAVDHGARRIPHNHSTPES